MNIPSEWRARQLAFLARLAGGRARHAADFADLYIGMHKKTLARDMEAWSHIAGISHGADNMGLWIRLAMPPAPPKTMKVCNKCESGELQPIENFGRVAANPDGYKNTCKKCSNANRRKWWASNSKAAIRYRKKK